MPINQLSDKKVQSIKTPGNYPDGGNLYLRVRESGSKSFIVKATIDKKQCEWTIGPYGTAEHQFSLAKARKQRDEIMAAIRAGRTPEATGKPITQNVEPEDASDPVPLFGSFALELVTQIEGGFRNTKHRDQWRSTLKTYCTSIWEKPVDQITTDDVLAILRPIWSSKAETASRLRGRMERVLNAAKVRGFRSGENPAVWQGHLQLLLPKRQKLQRGHHPALPFKDLPGFWEKLASLDTIASAALQFLILTAARSGELRGATWEEFDLEKRLWTVPASRMKAGREHLVPLSDSCMDILKRMQEIRHSTFVFPGAREAAPLSDMTLSKVLHSLYKGYTVHGFRSTFRDWCGEKTDFSREHAEACLAHTIGSAVERAYRRGNSLERRRRIMNAWEVFILTGWSPVDEDEAA
ncbi:site-specific integrase [Sinorhizobium medicae]|uniref:tyrosine-type recombinase/integrase n=1 Tax=Sinorhizobium medicae TaxID=110321 RepID=UPI000FD8B427|nr:site-specific integrase [Sinorhizobium medicae]RVJ33852.1 site-specific integrase [Sinorhizobium medicae]